MTVESYNYDEFISGQGEIRHVTVTIKAGQTLAKFTPLVHEAATGHYVAAASATTKAHYLTSFDVDSTTGAVEHPALSSITIDPASVAFPDGMTEPVKQGLFAGTPINIQAKRPF